MRQNVATTAVSKIAAAINARRQKRPTASSANKLITASQATNAGTSKAWKNAPAHHSATTAITANAKYKSIFPHREKPEKKIRANNLFMVTPHLKTKPKLRYSAIVSSLILCLTAAVRLTARVAVFSYRASSPKS